MYRRMKWNVWLLKCWYLYWYNFIVPMVAGEVCWLRLAVFDPYSALVGRERRGERSGLWCDSLPTSACTACLPNLYLLISCAGRGEWTVIWVPPSWTPVNFSGFQELPTRNWRSSPNISLEIKTRPCGLDLCRHLNIQLENVLRFLSADLTSPLILV